MTNEPEKKRKAYSYTMASLRLSSFCFLASALLHLSSALVRRGDTLEAGNFATPNLAAATCGRDNCVRLQLFPSHDA